MTSESIDSSTGRSLVWALRYLLPLVLLGLAVHVLLPQIATFEQSVQVVEGMVVWAVALAVAMQVLSYLGSGYLLKTLAAAVGQRLSLVRGTAIFTAASTVGLVAGGPVGNAAVTFRWMRGSGADGEGAMPPDSAMRAWASVSRTAPTAAWSGSRSRTRCTPVFMPATARGSSFATAR